MKEVEFKVGEVEYKIRKPSRQEFAESKKIYNLAFNDAIKSGSPLAARAKDILKDQGLWDESKQDELEKLQKEIVDKEYILEINPNGIRKVEARQIAIELRNLRTKLQELTVPLVQFNQHTAEGQADNARFDYFVSVCLVYKDGRQYFSGLEDYLNKSDDEVARVGAAKFADVFYGLDENYNSKLAENQFLKTYGFADEKFRLIDSKGRLIDDDGHLINEEGFRIDKDGDLVDLSGHKLDKDGKFKGEKKPFLD